MSLSSETTDYYCKNRYLPLYSKRGSGCGVGVSLRYCTFKGFHLFYELILIFFRRFNKTQLKATLNNLRISLIYLSRNMKSFVFFIITWALVASFPLDKQAQVNAISSYICNLSGFSTRATFDSRSGFPRIITARPWSERGS